jgi:hypothetical protein
MSRHSPPQVPQSQWPAPTRRSRASRSAAAVCVCKASGLAKKSRLKHFAAYHPQVIRSSDAASVDLTTLWDTTNERCVLSWARSLG